MSENQKRVELDLKQYKNEFFVKKKKCENYLIK